MYSMSVKSKKLLALLTALLLVVSMAGCLEKTEGEAPAATVEPAAEGEAAAASEIDYTLPAIELGNTVITVQDLSDMYASYASYMEYYGMEVDAEAALGYAEESCLQAFLNIWQAEVQGITLDDADMQKVNEEMDAARQEILDYYIQSAAESGAVESEADIEAYAIEMIEQELAGSGYLDGFEAYVADYVGKQVKNTALTEKVQNKFNETVTVTDEEVKTWYDATVAEQQQTFETAPADYEAVTDEFTSGVSKVPALVTPEGFIRIKTVLIVPEATLDAKHTENQTEMDTLEAEYGKLILNGEDAARQAEIKTAYASLKTENDALYEAYIVAAREKANRAQAALTAGTSFEDVMKEYGAAEMTDDEIKAGELLYTAEAQDDTDAKLIEAVSGLADGAYTQAPVQIGDSFYLVMRVGDEPAGTRTLEDAKELITAAALADKQETEWTAISEKWFYEAKEIAVYHRENYAGIAE